MSPPPPSKLRSEKGPSKVRLSNYLWRSDELKKAINSRKWIKI